MSRGDGEAHGAFARILIGASAAAYRAVVRIRYPRALRELYGSDMVDLFRAQLVARLHGGIARGLWSTWMVVLSEVLAPLPPPVDRVGSHGPEGAGARAGGRSEPEPPDAWTSGEGTTMTWKNRIRAALEDVSFAFRSLRREPRFTGLVVGVLAVGIALNVAVFAVLNAYLLRPLPYPHSERLVGVAAWGSVSWDEVDEVFEKAVSWDLDVFTLVGDGRPELTRGSWITPDFLDVYAVQPALGRTFTADEGGPGAAPVAMISHRLWRDRFGGDPGVLGRTFRAYMSDRPEEAEVFTIVGVLPADFWYFNAYTDVLVPIRDSRTVYTGRLRPDVTIQQAEQVLTRIATSRMDEVPPDFGVTLTPLQEQHVREVRPTLLVLQAATLLVLLIACANAGVLLLVRSTRRERELGVRRALGAAGGRLSRQLLAEGLIAVGLAGLLGTALASLGLGAAAEVLQTRLGPSVPGGLDALRIDAAVVAATVAICLVVGVAFGLVPVLTSARASLTRMLGASVRGGSDSLGRRRLRDAMVVAEVALSLALLTGAGLMVRSAFHLQTRELGFDPARIVRGQVGLRQASYPEPSDRHAVFDRLVDEVRALPGVDVAALVSVPPFTTRFVARTVEGQAGDGAIRRAEAVSTTVGDGYFDAMAVPVRRGRDFVGDDLDTTEPVAVVSESLAARLWPGEDPVGKLVRGTPMVMPGMPPPGPEAWRRVVGVAGDIQREVGGTDAGDLYLPFRQASPLWLNVVARAQPGVGSVVPAIESVLRDIDPEVPLSAVLDLERAVDQARAPTRFIAWLLAGFSAFALALAVVGLYGVVAYAARQRRKDVAIRMALGADREAVTGLFLAQGLLVVVAGVALGTVGGYGLGRALEAELHGVVPGDPATHVALAGLLMITAALAVWLPARGAAATDPMGVLRED